MWSSTLSGGDVAVVGGDGLADARRLAELLEERRADDGVRALLLVVGGLADVVEAGRRGAPASTLRPSSGRHQAGEEADLDEWASRFWA